MALFDWRSPEPPLTPDSETPFYIESTFGSMAKSLTPKLQGAARDAGWPDEAAESLSVVSEHGRLTWASTMPYEAIERLELGTETEPPKAALSSFFESSETKAAIKRDTSMFMQDFAAMLNRMWS